ncbi:hypothetical protein ACVWZN_002918 [Lysobacter sp. HA35]
MLYVLLAAAAAIAPPPQVPVVSFNHSGADRAVLRVVRHR